MTMHNISFDIEFYDEALRKKIEEEAYKEVIEGLKDEAKKSIMYHVYNTGWRDNNEKADWSRVLNKAVDELVEENKEEIIEAAAKKLCESFRRSKPFKETMMEVFLNQLQEDE